MPTTVDINASADSVGVTGARAEQRAEPSSDEDGCAVLDE